MAIAVTCPSCAKPLRFNDNAVGKTGKCRGCGKSLAVDGKRIPNYDAFISYSIKDKLVADAICSRLESRNIRCWIAPRDAQPGKPWAGAILDAIADVHLMVLVFSSNSNVSQQVLREVDRAVGRGVTIIPFMIEATPLSKEMEYYISTSHWFDAVTPPLEKHISILSDSILGFMLGEADALPPAAKSSKQNYWLWRIKNLSPVSLVALVACVLMVLLTVSLLWVGSRWGGPGSQADRKDTQAPLATGSGSEKKPARPDAEPFPNVVGQWADPSQKQQAAAAAERQKLGEFDVYRFFPVWIELMKFLKFDPYPDTPSNPNHLMSSRIASSAIEIDAKTRALSASGRLQLPKRFAFTGQPAGVRADESKLWVALVDGDTAIFPIPAIAAVEFENPELATELSDFKLFDRVTVVVERNAPPMGDTSRDRVQDSDAMQAYRRELKMLMGSAQQAIGPVWYLKGLAVEWHGKTPRWISPHFSRGEPTNLELLQDSPGYLLRQPPRSPSRLGTLRGRYHSSNIKDDNLIVNLLCDSLLEGRFFVIVNCGDRVSPSELRRIREKDAIDVVCTIDGLADADYRAYWMRSMRGAQLFDNHMISNPTLSRGGLSATGYSIHIPEIAEAYRRAVPPADSITPQYVMQHFGDKELVGVEVIWKGRLHSISRKWGEVHWEIHAPSGLRQSFEAFTKDEHFFADSLDYLDDESDNGYSSGDAVTIKGTIRASDGASMRLNDLVPLLEMKEVERAGDPNSRIVMGQRRALGYVPPMRDLRPGSLARLIRENPDVGERASFDAEYHSFSDSSHLVVLTAVPFKRTAHVVFPKATKADFQKFQKGDHVRVEAYVKKISGIAQFEGINIDKATNASKVK